jgi:hypothetical protein
MFVRLQKAGQYVQYTANNISSVEAGVQGRCRHVFVIVRMWAYSVFPHFTWYFFFWVLVFPSVIINELYGNCWLGFWRINSMSLMLHNNRIHAHFVTDMVRTQRQVLPITLRNSSLLSCITSCLIATFGLLRCLFH